MEYLKLENTGDKTKNPKDGLNRQVETAEEKNGEPEDRSEKQSKTNHGDKLGGKLEKKCYTNIIRRHIIHRHNENS